jgi:hypothetical protein
MRSRAALLAVALAIVGCSDIETVTFEETFERVVHEKRTGRLGTFLIERTYRLLACDTAPIGTGVELRFAPGSELSSGSAAAVTTSGYLLTAKHCVGRNFLFAASVAGREWRPARVVATADPDLALVKVDAELPAAFEWATDGERAKEVAACGFPGVSGHAELSAGEVTTASIDHDVTRFQFTSLVLPGNSGGPLARLDGRLLGVVQQWAWKGKDKAFTHGNGAGPDPLWVEEQIEADLARLSSRTPPKSLFGLARALRARNAGATVGYRDLETGRTIGIELDLPRRAGELRALPVSIELFAQAAEGTLDLDAPILIENRFRSRMDGSVFAISEEQEPDRETFAMIGRTVAVRELAKRMVVRSSCLATNLILARVGADRVLARAKALGATRTSIELVGDERAFFAQSYRNETTARDLLRLLERVARREVAGADGLLELLEPHPLTATEHFPVASLRGPAHGLAAIARHPRGDHLIVVLGAAREETVRELVATIAAERPMAR